ncbi:MAG: hypothetical protein OEX97_05745, partial [Acidimicrobiia bacterium]|nr:hypothetical protein [Acidimicrobiia bacterium]
APFPRNRRVVTIGVLLLAGSAAAVAQLGITTSEAVIRWIIPVAAIAGAVMVGALPAGKKRG